MTNVEIETALRQLWSDIAAATILISTENRSKQATSTALRDNPVTIHVAE